jgi:hypothetical protein
VCCDDQAVDVLSGRVRAHRGASIERRLGAINAIACLLLGALPAGAASLPSWLQVSGRLYGLAIIDTGGGPRQRPESIGTLEIQATPTHALRGLLELRGRVGGPFEGGPGPAVYNFGEAFQNNSPALEVRQAFLEWRDGPAEVRAGIQTFAWGKLDGRPPTDVVNPRDWHDPLVVDEFFEEQKIGIPALLGTYYLPDVPRFDLSGLRFALGWIPFAVPPRLPLILERWFPSAIGVPSQVCVSSGQLPGGGGCGPHQLPVQVGFATENDVPARTFENGAVAARLSGTWRGADLDLYHYTGQETAPDAQLRALVSSRTPFPDVRLHAAARLVQDSQVMHMTGGDAALALGDFTVRAEAAWFVNHSYLSSVSDVIAPLGSPTNPIVRQVAARVAQGKSTNVQLAPLFPALDSVEWGIGADTLWHGFQPLLQLNQIIILGHAPRLLISDPETQLSGTLRRRFADDRVEAEVRGLWEIERGALYLFPRVSYLVREGLWLRAGYLVLTGTRNSLLGQYRANDEVVFQARMTF